MSYAPWVSDPGYVLADYSKPFGSAVGLSAGMTGTVTQVADGQLIQINPAATSDFLRVRCAPFASPVNLSGMERIKLLTRYVSALRGSLNQPDQGLRFRITFHTTDDWSNFYWTPQIGNGWKFEQESLLALMSELAVAVNNAGNYTGDPAVDLQNCVTTGIYVQSSVTGVAQQVVFKNAVRDWKLHYSPIFLTFDDNHATVFTKLLPIMQQYGWTADIFANGNSVGNLDRLSTAQLTTLADLGWPIQGHTFDNPDANLGFANVVQPSIEQNVAFLAPYRRGSAPLFNACPQGEYDQDWLAYFQANGYGGHRGTKTATGGAQFWTDVALDSADYWPWEHKSIGINFDSSEIPTANAWLSLIDQAVSYHMALVFNGHILKDAADGAPTNSIEYVTEEFQSAATGMRQRENAGQIRPMPLSTGVQMITQSAENLTIVNPANEVKVWI